MTQTDEPGKTEKLEVRLTYEEKSYIIGASRRAGLSQSDFVRLVLMEVSRKIYQGANVKEVGDTMAGTATVLARLLVEVTPFQFVPMPSMGIDELNPYEIKGYNPFEEQKTKDEEQKRENES